MTRRWLTVAVTAALLSGVWGAVTPGAAPAARAVALPPAADGATACAQTNAAGRPAIHRAGLVVVLPEETRTFCIDFAGDAISGEELLRRSGLDVVFTGFGGLGAGVCRIEDVGCADPGDCFCQCRSGECHFWAYFALDEGGWRFQSVGPSTRRLEHGDVDAWVWGSSRTPPGAKATGGLCVTPAPPVAPPPTPLPPAAERLSAGQRTPPARPTASGSREAVSAPASPPATPVRLTPTAGLLTQPATEMTASVRSRDAGDREPRPADERDPPAGGTGGGVPAGLIAFGVVAGGLAAVAGGVAVRGRLRG